MGLVNLNGSPYNFSNIPKSTVPSMTEQVGYVPPTTDVTVDLFGDTTAPDFEFNVGTLSPTLDFSSGNLLGFQEFNMTPEQKTDYGIEDTSIGANTENPQMYRDIQAIIDSRLDEYPVVKPSSTGDRADEINNSGVDLNSGARLEAAAPEILQYLRDNGYSLQQGDKLLNFQGAAQVYSLLGMPKEYLSFTGSTGSYSGSFDPPKASTFGKIVNLGLNVMTGGAYGIANAVLNGGSIEDIAKAAAIAYAGGQIADMAGMTDALVDLGFDQAYAQTLSQTIGGSVASGANLEETLTAVIGASAQHGLNGGDFFNSKEDLVAGVFPESMDVNKELTKDVVEKTGVSLTTNDGTIITRNETGGTTERSSTGAVTNVTISDTTRYSGGSTNNVTSEVSVTDSNSGTTYVRTTDGNYVEFTGAAPVAGFGEISQGGYLTASGIPSSGMAWEVPTGNYVYKLENGETIVAPANDDLKSINGQTIVSTENHYALSMTSPTDGLGRPVRLTMDNDGKIASIEAVQEGEADLDPSIPPVNDVIVEKPPETIIDTSYEIDTTPTPESETVATKDSQEANGGGGGGEQQPTAEQPVPSTESTGGMLTGGTSGGSVGGATSGSTGSTGGGLTDVGTSTDSTGGTGEATEGTGESGTGTSGTTGGSSGTGTTGSAGGSDATGTQGSQGTTSGAESGSGVSGQQQWTRTGDNEWTDAEGNIYKYENIGSYDLGYTAGADSVIQKWEKTGDNQYTDAEGNVFTYEELGSYDSGFDTGYGQGYGEGETVGYGTGYGEGYGTGYGEGEGAGFGRGQGMATTSQSFAGGNIPEFQGYMGGLSYRKLNPYQTQDLIYQPSVVNSLFGDYLK